VEPPFFFDANIIIDGRVQSYPPDIFPTLWEFMAEFGDGPNGRMPREVLEEIERGDDDCASWCRDRRDFVVDATDGVLTVVAEIAGSYPDWAQGMRNYADPFLVANAEIAEGTVITNESYYRGTIESRLKIPNICEARGVTCGSFFTFIRFHGLRF
jgi:hypothetical protein